MKRLPSILACGAAMAALSTADAGRPQGERAGLQELGRAEPGPVVVRRKRPVAAPQQRARGLANQLRPYYRYELMHIRTACGLTREQLREIRPEADAAYEEAIGRIEAAIRPVRVSSGAEGPDYVEAIHEAVVGIFQRHLTLAQRAAYEEDLRLRWASRKEAGVDLMVAVLDCELLLTGRQRQQIAASLSAHWEDRWSDAVEVAFNQRACCPRFPDRLVEPSLSAAQRETWRHIPRFQGRLWGVTIDHGGDPAMEQELGADATGMWPTRWRPIIPLRLASAPAATGRLAWVQEPAARPGFGPAAVVRPAPVPVQEDDPDGEADPALVRQQRLQLAQQEQMALYRQQYFDRVAFGRTTDGRTTQDSFRAQFESILDRQIDHLERGCQLSESQKRKLRAAGQGDLKRFFDRVAEARRKHQAIEDLRALVAAIQKESASFAEERTALLASKGPIFTRALPRTLTDNQRASLEDDGRDRRAFRYRADVRWTAVMLARSLGLIDDQRRRLESLLLEATRPPLQFGTFDYVIVLYQASRIPEEKVRPIFDDLQWRVMTQEFAAIRRWELHLKKGGFLPAEMFDEKRDPALPPIHLLDPPLRSIER